MDNIGSEVITAVKVVRKDPTETLREAIHRKAKEKRAAAMEKMWADIDAAPPLRTRGRR